MTMSEDLLSGSAEGLTIFRDMEIRASYQDEKQDTNECNDDSNECNDDVVWIDGVGTTASVTGTGEQQQQQQDLIYVNSDHDSFPSPSYSEVSEDDKAATYSEISEKENGKSEVYSKEYYEYGSIQDEGLLALLRNRSFLIDDIMRPDFATNPQKRRNCYIMSPFVTAPVNFGEIPTQFQGSRTGSNSPSCTSVGRPQSDLDELPHARFQPYLPCVSNPIKTSSFPIDFQSINQGTSSFLASFKDYPNFSADGSENQTNLKQDFRTFEDQPGSAQFPHSYVGPSMSAAPQRCSLKSEPSYKQREKRNRNYFTSCQLDELQAAFNSNPYLDEEGRKRLSVKINLTSEQIKNWFQNQRSKGRRNEVAMQKRAAINQGPVHPHLLYQNVL